MNRSFLRGLALAVAVLCVAAVVLFGVRRCTTSAVPRYRTAPVTQGRIVESVGASGTLNPVKVVSVGTQVSGTVKRLLVDFNDKVVEGQLLAEIDAALYSAQLAQTSANLRSAEVGLQISAANEARIRGVISQGYVSKQDLDKAIEARAAAQAQKSALQAQLARDRSNIGFTRIKAPVSGVVLSRDVAIGQTVAASFQTPTLFKIAQDLRSMRIEASVAEADVGRVNMGQSAVFTVDTYPGTDFRAQVRQLRLNPTVEQGVVTYTVVLDVDNAALKLLPGMTAAVRIQTSVRDNVRRVPTAALNFRPKNAADGKVAGAPLPGERVFVMRDGNAVAIGLRVGVADETYTEVIGDALRDGDLVIVGESLPTDANSAAPRRGPPGGPGL